jgi:hypothetical protein
MDGCLLPLKMAARGRTPYGLPDNTRSEALLGGPLSISGDRGIASEPVEMSADQVKQTILPAALLLDPLVFGWARVWPEMVVLVLTGLRRPGGSLFGGGPLFGGRVWRVVARPEIVVAGSSVICDRDDEAGLEGVFVGVDACGERVPEVGVGEEAAAAAGVVDDGDLEWGASSPKRVSVKVAMKATSRMTSFVTRPPVLRMTSALPGSIPRMCAGSTRPSMQVTTKTLYWGPASTRRGRRSGRTPCCAPGVG